MPTPNDPMDEVQAELDAQAHMPTTLEAGSLAHPHAPALPSGHEALSQLTNVLQWAKEQGYVHQRPDGSYLLPGQGPDPRWQHRVAIGSACECSECTIHNQRHWVCMICEQLHQYVMTQDKPRTMRTELGTAGRRGTVHLVDSNECALEYRRRMGQGLPVAGVPGMPVAVSGGDDGYEALLMGGA